MTRDRMDEPAMEERIEAAENSVPLREHPLFVEAEHQLAAGDNASAAQTLRRLTYLYPEDETLRELEMRAALRSTFTVADSIPVRRAQPGALLRTLLLFLILIATCLTAAAGFGLAYDRWVVPNREQRERELYIANLWQNADRRLTAGDLTGAREVLDKLAVALPGDPQVEAAYALLGSQQALIQMYETALQKEADGDWTGARDLLRALEGASPGFRDTREHMIQVEKQIELEGKWQEAQKLVADGDWPSAVALLTEIRRDAPDMHRTEVVAYLFEAYSRVARQLLADAGGNVAQMQQAIEYLDLALELQPTHRDLGEERRLARLYVAGAAAYTEENWVQAVRSWQPLHRMRPDYQGGIIDTYLYQAYPKAAAALLAGAKGEGKPIEQAIEYLDHVLGRSADDPAIVEERTLAVEYVTGLDAYNARRWDEAIVHWGPIYLVRPSYQDGVLEDRLRVACAATDLDYASWCPP